ncbi:MAG: SDR family NAD(P)-dependent oxidoreductase [Deltaproteobacteria bacterium]|nr:SDR family NAD(P)-dependent oxidoreductase [Deltaproteobacteria bacterium]MBW2086333.1 SDR family NAD(P)-dependent oxidoreductase [Deltaproteobacteria bacterium]
MNIRFDNRVAIITGGGRGVGKAHALLLGSRGAKVVVNDLGGSTDGKGDGSEAPAQKVVDEIKAAGGEAVVSFNSVADPHEAEAIVQTALDHFGTVDILINCAGILRDKTFFKMSLEDFEFVLKIHLLGSIYVTKAAFPVMREKDYGRIIMTASAAGLYGNFGQTNYSTAKLGLVGFMNTLKEEGQRYNICINTIVPWAYSRLGLGIFPEEVLKYLRPELVAAAAAFLSSEQCTASGDIIIAGLGYFAKAQMVESQGVRFDPFQDVTPEMLAERYQDITNMEKARPFTNSSEAFLAALGPLNPELED